MVKVKPEINCDQKINSLKGDQSVSETGKPCLNWNEVQESSLFARFQKFSIPTHNKCRNPNKDGEGPWCYVKERSNIRVQIDRVSTRMDC